VRCSSSRRLFERLLDASLSARTEHALRLHFERCSDCAAIFEQFRVVDALLLRPPAVDLAPNFTQRAMAEMQAIRAPRPAPLSVLPFLAVYLAASWLGIGLALVFAGSQTRAVLATMLATSGNELTAVAAFAQATAHSFGSGLFELTAVSAGTLLLDVTIAFALAGAYIVLRPRPESPR
jgi:anti-sigma factor RsiW